MSASKDSNLESNDDYLSFEVNQDQRVKVRDHIKKSLLVSKIMPLVRVARLLGPLPIAETSRGFEFKVFSRHLLVCLIAYILNTVCSGMVLSEVINFFVLSEEFSEKMYAQVCVMLIVPYTLIPVTVWQDCHEITRYFNNWTEFQVTRTRLRLNIDKKVFLSIFLIIFEPMIIVLGVMYLPPYLSIWQATIPAFATVYQMCAVCFFVLVCDAICQSSKQVAHKFKVDVKRNPHSATHVAQYHRLWLHLTDVASHTGACAFRTYGLYVLYSVWILTSALYGCITSVTNKDSVAIAAFVTLTVLCGGPVYIVCNSGHMVQTKVKDSILKEIKKIVRTNVNPQIWLEVNVFLTDIDTTMPVPNVGGFATIDRHLFRSITAAIATYLIVLLQFQSTYPAAIEDNTGKQFVQINLCKNISST